MMKAITTILLALMSLSAYALPRTDSLSVEEMYGAYDKDGKYRAVQEQVDQVVRQVEAAEKEKAEKRRMALWIALAVAVVPLGVIGKQIIGQRTWENNPKGTCQALAIGLASAVVLFALNYGIFLLKMEYGSTFNTALVVVLVVSLVIGAIYVVRK